MKKIALACILLVTFASSAVAKDIPMSLAGIQLGGHIDEYHAQCMDNSDMPLSDAMFLNEVSIDTDSFPGLRGGSIAYGNCASPGTIVWVKLKFEDRSMDMFEQLLEMYDNTLGDDRKWEGDAFHIVTSWRWEFEQDGKQVDVLLTHSKNPEFRPGVSVKMTLRSQFNTEYMCWKQAAPKRHRKKQGHSINLEQFIPR